MANLIPLVEVLIAEMLIYKPFFSEEHGWLVALRHVSVALLLSDPLAKGWPILSLDLGSGLYRLAHVAAILTH